MKKPTLLFFLVLLTISSYSQQLLEWQQHYGGNYDDRVDAMVESLDDGFVLLGFTASSDTFDVSENKGGYDFWLVKTDHEGTLLWERTLGGAGLDEGRDLRATDDGGYILIGSSPSLNADVGGNNGNYDYWVVKTDGMGVIEWEKNLGGTGNDRGWSICTSSDGGYIAMGHTYSENIDIGDNNGSSDYWIVKLDESGNILWERNYGGSNTDRARNIQATTDGGYILIGYTPSDDVDVGGNNGDDDVWIVKINAEGLLEWEQNYGGSDDEAGRIIKQTADGGYIVGGTSKSSDGGIPENQGGKDVWLFKLDADGVLEWQQSYGGSQTDIVRDVQHTSDGGYILCGESSSSDGDVNLNQGGLDVWVIKTDSLGTLLWEKTLGGSANELSYSVVESEPNAYVIAAYGRSDDGDLIGNYGGDDFWLLKIRDCFFPDLANSKLEACEAIEGDGRASFNLNTTFEDLITYYGFEAKWFTAANDNSLINNTNAFISGDSTIFLQLSVGDCTSDFLPIHLLVHPISSPTFLNEEICEGDEAIVINDQAFDQSGIYSIDGLTNVHGCDSIVILDLEVINPLDLPVANAGEDQIVSKPVAILSGNETEDTFGFWSYWNSATIAEEMNAATEVSNLEEGNNSFSWSLDHPLCGMYSSDTVNILYQKNFFLPNVFTPNGDGDNDLFTVPGLYNNGVTEFHFSVFNRRGVQVFQISPYQNDWDGRDQQGKELAEGTYYFVLSGGELRYDGAVLIVR